MPDILRTLGKAERKRRLFEIGFETLQAQGWKVERVPGLGKASVRRITRGDKSLLVSIRTTQDRWIAFPPKEGGKGWITLDEVDVVLAVSVDDNAPPKVAEVHWFDATDMRARFDRAAKARRDAGYQEPKYRRGVWLPLYIADDGRPSYVGGGAAIGKEPLAIVPLDVNVSMATASRPDDADGPQSDQPLTIAEAKRRLALSLGVAEANVKITVEA